MTFEIDLLDGWDGHLTAPGTLDAREAVDVVRSRGIISGIQPEVEERRPIETIATASGVILAVTTRAGENLRLRLSGLG